LNWKFTGDLSPVYRLIKVLYKESPDIVFITEAVNFLYYRIAKFFYFNNIVHVGSFRALTFWKGHLNKYYNYIDIILSKWFYNFSDIIVVNSMAMKLNYEKILKIKKSNPIKVIYNASDFNFTFKPNSQILKDKLGIDSHFVITQVARLDPWKDFETLISAIEILKFKGFSLKLLLVGGGVLKENIQKILIDKKLTNDIILTGETNNAHQFINISDICVLSSNGEGFSNSILEYMYHSKAVVASDVGGNVELIGNNKYGRLFKKGSVDDLCIKLEELLDNSELRNYLGVLCNKHIRDLCDINKYINGYEELFKNEMLK
jgi:glycosyltransferase involved in cell wall biosynthesis